MLISNTPVEPYLVEGEEVLVKREDLSALPPAPPFSKVRGLLPHLDSLKRSGYSIIGYTETAISMAGWGVAWGCKEIGDLRAVIFDPQYKEPHPVLEYHRSMWKQFGAEIRPIKAGMARVNWNISRNLLRKAFGEKKSILLPLGLPLEQTIKATAVETRLTLDTYPNVRSIVVNVGSGTIAAGVWKGAHNWVEKDPTNRTISVYGIMGRTGDVQGKRKKITEKAGLALGDYGLFRSSVPFYLEDPHWEYMDRCDAPCPFPSHPYYDRKAWDWLVKNLSNLPKPVLFWNIGH